MHKYRYYLTLLALISVLLSSCSDTQKSKVKEPQTPQSASSSLSQDSALRLSRQIRLLGEYSAQKYEVITISDTKSMIPTLDSNSLAIIEKNVQFDSLRAGDIIVYKNTDKKSKYFNQNIIHRIRSINIDQKTLSTKGDSNDQPDTQTAKPDDILGRVFCILYYNKDIK